jgi:hypothetical protein
LGRRSFFAAVLAETQTYRVYSGRVAQRSGNGAAIDYDSHVS